MAKASILISWCNDQVGSGYVYGTVGEILTPTVLKRVRTMYGALMGDSYFTKRCQKWLGAWVCDCSGLFKAARKSIDSVWADVSAQGTYDQCKERGSIDTMPIVPGVFVFRYGTSGGVKRMVHVGMYVGKGKVVEARGVDFGVVLTDLKARGWTHWGKPSWVYYDLLPEKIEIPAASKIEDDAGDASTKKPDDARPGGDDDPIPGYKKIIQGACGFSNPDGVWAVLDKHPYPQALYMQLARGCSKG